jgi:TPR repeat protein
LFSFSYRCQYCSRKISARFGDLLIHIGVKLKSKSHSSLEASSWSPVQESGLNAGSRLSVPKPKLDTPPEETQNPADAPAATETNQRTADPLEPSLAPRQNSPQHFVDPHFRAGRSALARQLWSAIGAGDSSAEVPLAELYLKGDGVPKNCEQAAVLLRAASKNGNVEAPEKSKKLSKKGCR